MNHSSRAATRAATITPAQPVDQPIDPTLSKRAAQVAPRIEDTDAFYMRVAAHHRFSDANRLGVDRYLAGQADTILSDQRRELLEWGRQRGWPLVFIHPWMTLPATERSWRVFCRNGSNDEIAYAREALAL